MNDIRTSQLRELRRLIDEEIFVYELNSDWERVVNVKVVELAREYLDMLEAWEQ